MKNTYIKSGFWQQGVSDEKLALNLTKVVSEVMNLNGYPTSTCCANKYELSELNYADDIAASASNKVAIGSLYHTNGVVKIRLV